MSKLNRIGLDTTKSAKLVNLLNELLSNYQIFYQNARGFHWNIKGDKFFELHVNFEELYNDALLKIDEIAERILTLGYTPLHTYTDYLKRSKVKEVRDLSDGYKSVAAVISGFSEIIKVEREILELSEKAKDEGTNSLISDYISQQEKLVWMYSSFLNNKN